MDGGLVWLTSNYQHLLYILSTFSFKTIWQHMCDQLYICLTQRGVWGKATSSEKKEHWVDYAADVYSSQLVQDTKILLELIYLFSPTILFWALYEQQVSISYNTFNNFLFISFSRRLSNWIVIYNVKRTTVRFVQH